MPLTDPEGNPIPKDDPRLPTAEATAEVAREADLIQARVEQLVGQAIGPLVDIEAQVKALASLLIPPDGPARALFEYRTQAARVETLRGIEAQVTEVRKGPKIVLARSIPADLSAYLPRA